MCLENAFKSILCCSLQKSLTLRNINPRFCAKAEHCNNRPCMSIKCLTEAADQYLLSLLCSRIFFYLSLFGFFPGGKR